MTWAKNALGTEKSIPTPFLAGIAVTLDRVNKSRQFFLKNQTLLFLLLY